jgi:hypothetical protein
MHDFEVDGHTQAGYPFIAVESDTQTAAAVGDALYIFEEGDYVPPGWLINLGVPILPVRPVWPGFAADTVLFAGVLLGAVSGYRWARGRRRVGRGCCRVCGYDLAGAPSRVCPECGRAVSLSPPASSDRPPAEPRA